MPALISSLGVYTANESCVYEGPKRLKNSITTPGSAWPTILFKPWPTRVVQRPQAETTDGITCFRISHTDTSAQLKQNYFASRIVSIHLERLFTSSSTGLFIGHVGKTRDFSVIRRKIRDPPVETDSYDTSLGFKLIHW